MRVVLLRVGIDTGEGGISSPLFADGQFELVRSRMLAASTRAPTAPRAAGTADC